ncbi:MAG: exodeoxyribonuclease VII small subunit [Coriobacteriia bacterium]|nr:exodeoxyribonuclease VII small subunit [Coriobacteriia bacterium]
MADERYTFEQAKARLEEIASEVRKKDTSLERSLDLLEEGVRLANICTELVDHTDLSADTAGAGAAAEDSIVVVSDVESSEDGTAAGAETDESLVPGDTESSDDAEEPDTEGSDGAGDEQDDSEHDLDEPSARG